MARGCAEPALRDLFRDLDALDQKRLRLYAELMRGIAAPLTVRDRETLAQRRYSRDVLGPALDNAILEALQPKDGA